MTLAYVEGKDNENSTDGCTARIVVTMLSKAVVYIYKEKYVMEVGKHNGLVWIKDQSPLPGLICFYKTTMCPYPPPILMMVFPAMHMPVQG
jgi:hypothetical protein